MAGKKYTEAQIERALCLREKGLSYSQIQRLTGMNSRSVQRYCLINAVDSPAMADKPDCYHGPEQYVRNGQIIRRFSSDEDEQILEWAIEGMARNEIARRLNRPHNSVRNRLASLAMRDQRSELARKAA